MIFFNFTQLIYFLFKIFVSIKKYLSFIYGNETLLNVFDAIWNLI